MVKDDPLSIRLKIMSERYSCALESSSIVQQESSNGGIRSNMLPSSGDRLEWVCWRRGSSGGGACSMIDLFRFIIVLRTFVQHLECKIGCFKGSV